MSHDLQRTMRAAMQLMRQGDLAAATATLQRNLAGQPQAQPLNAQTIGKGRCIDSVARVVPESANEDIPAPQMRRAESSGGLVSSTGTFSCRHGARDYLMYAPRERQARSGPLLLMLHGCAQTPADFARGTRMHVSAAAEGYVVVYAAQSTRHNPNACWNWFRAEDQQRGQGEPALLAEMVGDFMRRLDCDPDRVYVAGLSAGAAMALNLAHLYPEVLRGVGVHSGLPFGCAHDVPSAMTAMRNGGNPHPDAGTDGTLPHLVPTIVFHGDRDAIVSVRNADRIVGNDVPRPAAPRAANDGLWESASTTRAADRFAYTVTRERSPSGKPMAERWIVHGAGHAWFGGSPQGSFTDPRGPDATAEMLRFFRDVERAGR